jgi:hypothetical protein
MAPKDFIALELHGHILFAELLKTLIAFPLPLQGYARSIPARTYLNSMMLRPRSLLIGALRIRSKLCRAFASRRRSM